MSTRRRVRSGTGFENEYGYCRAVAVGELIVVAGTAPVPPDGQPIALGAFDQMLRCGEIVAAALADLGDSPGAGSLDGRPPTQAVGDQERRAHRGRG